MKKQNSKANKLKKIIEEENKEVEEFNREETKLSGFESKDAFKNMDEGFDPLGGGKFKPKDISQNPDDLMGWHK